MTLRTRGDLRDILVQPLFLVGMRGPLGQAGSTLTKIKHDLEEMRTAQVVSCLLVSLFFVEFTEWSFCSSHHFIPDSVSLSGIETAPSIKKLSFRNLFVKL